MNLFKSALIVAACGAAFSLNAGEEDKAKAIAAMEGGNPLPAGTHTFEFPDSAKQSISFVSDAEERIAGVIAFSGEGAIGGITVNVDEGTGSGSFSVPVAHMKTGHDGRDKKMGNPEWLDSANHSDISFKATSINKLSPTVWEVTGDWTVKGTSKTMTSLANVRFIPKFPRFGENVVRVRASFDLPLKEFGVDNPSVGTPAVAEVWNVEVTLLGLLKTE